jgi:gamma-aminobutyric acid type B receptor
MLQLRAFLFAAGFSLTFGAMFAKTFRVHRILKQAHGALVRSKLLKDKHLLCLIGGLLMIDVIIICLWIFFDPMKKSIHNLTLEVY